MSLATIWLFDGILQLQPFMFTKQFSGMLRQSASGTPHVVFQSINWNATLVSHHAVASNAIFALLQVLIGLGIAWRFTLKAALAVSIAWSFGVWWFGEGLGGMLAGAANPVSGAPGAVLLYALLAVLLWPHERPDGDAPFPAARAVGAPVAKAIWATLWGGLGVLMLLASNRSADGLHDLLTGMAAGQPAWLASMDHHLAALVGGRGLVAAIVLAVLFFAVGAGVYLPVHVARLAIAFAGVLAVAIWVAGEGLGGFLASGQATDPNSGPLLILLAVAYWPTVARRPADATHRVPVTTTLARA